MQVGAPGTCRWGADISGLADIVLMSHVFQKMSLAIPHKGQFWFVCLSFGSINSNCAYMAIKKWFMVWRAPSVGQDYFY